MKVKFSPSFANGAVCAPPSKSMAHRLLICAGLSPGESRISNLAFSEDISATADCLTALGARIRIEKDRAFVTGVDPASAASNGDLQCGACGSTLRFMLPLCMLSGRPAVLTGTKRLLERPLNVYEDICREQNIELKNDGTKVTVCGKLHPGAYSVPGDVSSQFISGLLFALPLLDGNSTLRITGRIESRPYIDMTLSALSDAGIKIDADNGMFNIPGNQAYLPIDLAVEGDWSNAAFLYALKTTGHSVEINGLGNDSLQGDRVCVSYFRALTEGTPTLSVADCPDLAPVLMAVAAEKNGVVLTGTRRLRIKESDRGVAMARELSRFGVDVLVEDDRIVVPGGKLYAPDMPLSSHDDHRIAMALSVLLVRTGGMIEGVEAVRKSYPDFFEILEHLGVDLQYEA